METYLVRLQARGRAWTQEIEVQAADWNHAAELAVDRGPDDAPPGHEWFVVGIRAAQV